MGLWLVEQEIHGDGNSIPIEFITLVKLFYPCAILNNRHRLKKWKKQRYLSLIMKKTTKFLMSKMNSINYITIQTLAIFQNSKKSSNALPNFIWVSPDFEAHKISFKNTENLPEFLIENLVLDCNSGRIGFGSETDWYGWCFDSLKGLNLYPGKVNNRFQFEAIGITI